MTTTQKQAALVSLVALGTIMHDGETYEDGDPIKVPEKQAAQLVASGSASTEGVASAMAKASQRGEEAKRAQEKADAEVAEATRLHDEATAKARTESDAAAALAVAGDVDGAKSGHAPAKKTSKS